MSLLIGVCATALTLSAGTAASGVQNTPPAGVTERDGVQALLTELERAIAAHSANAFWELLAGSADPVAEVDRFDAYLLTQPFSSATFHERDRAELLGTLPGNGYRVTADLFASDGRRARVEHWEIDVKRVEADTWRIVRHDITSTIQGLYRLALSGSKAYAAQGLTLGSEDFTLRLPRGHVFVAEADGAPTALVLQGDGEFVFTPKPAAERGQLKIFSGREELRARFRSAYVRLNPDVMIPAGQLVDEPVSSPVFQRADEIFRLHVGESFVLDLGDLSAEPWSLLPGPGDFLAEVHTRDHGVLTYTRSRSEPEDVSLFERRRHRTIAQYSSPDQSWTRHGSYSDDDRMDYHVARYDIDATFDPNRNLIDGVAELAVVVRAAATENLTVRLADPLIVSSVTSDVLGRLLFLRVRNQNSLLVNLPRIVSRGTQFTLRIAYRGVLSPQENEREAMQFPGRQPPREEEPLLIEPERSLMYSNRSYWYPQSPSGDYATAALRLTVPESYAVAASGTPETPTAGVVSQGQRTFTFTASRPLRYLSCLISRFVRADRASAAPRASAPPIAVLTNPRQLARARQTAERAQQIAAFYESLMGDFPYPSLSVAVTESNVPGGHSPAYLVALNEPLATTPYVWRNDPTNFSDFPGFFLAHEMAHQWWGHAIGWKNYHEQWLSEAFASYFAALYVNQDRGPRTFQDVMQRMRRWAVDMTDQGPISLGYRLGHIQGDPKIFRAIVYDKGAWVVHMLRGLVGDETFFKALRRFYEVWRFQKAGTDDLQKTFEEESGLDLSRFFEQWVRGTGIPRLDYRMAAGPTGQTLTLQQVGELFDYPIDVTVVPESGEPVRIVVKIREREQTVTLPLSGPLKRIAINEGLSALCQITKGS